MTLVFGNKVKVASYPERRILNSRPCYGTVPIKVSAHEMMKQLWWHPWETKTLTFSRSNTQSGQSTTKDRARNCKSGIRMPTQCHIRSDRMAGTEYLTESLNMMSFRSCQCKRQNRGTMFPYGNMAIGCKESEPVCFVFAVNHIEEGVIAEIARMTSRHRSYGSPAPFEQSPNGGIRYAESGCNLGSRQSRFVKVGHLAALVWRHSPCSFH